MLQFSFSAPVGDQEGDQDFTDLIGVTCVFDNTTGDYEITLTATSTNPFTGRFRINMIFYNPDAGTTQDPGLFSDRLNDFHLGTDTTTTVSLSGKNTRLLSWAAGDRVASDSSTFGVPTDSRNIVAFWSGITSRSAPGDPLVFGDYATIEVSPPPPSGGGGGGGGG